MAIIPNVFRKKGLEPATARGISIVAHRGGAGLGPENTLGCIERGIAAGADAVEIDIHLSSDGHLIVCHDESVDRTTDGKGMIRDMTLDELRKLRIKYEGNLTSEHLPTLAEVLQTVDGRVELLIEIKRKGDVYAGIEEKLLYELERYDAWNRVTVQSFNDSVLETLHREKPSLKLEKLFLFKFPLLPLIFDGTVTAFNFSKYSYVNSFNIMYTSASAHLVKEIKRRGYGVKIWTMDDPGKTPRLPVDGIITDRPDIWVQYRENSL